MINQCDGCLRGLPLFTSLFGGLVHRGSGPWDIIGCTQHLYETPKAVCVVFVDGDEYLAITRPKKGDEADRWGFPGGKIDPGETPLQAAVREIQEEIGLTIREDQLMLLHSNIVEGQQDYETTTFLFTGETPALVSLVPEAGLKLGFVGQYILTHKDHSPFWEYNLEVMVKLHQHLDTNAEDWA